jgi:hypothetical protein
MRVSIPPDLTNAVYTRNQVLTSDWLTSLATTRAHRQFVVWASRFHEKSIR